MFNQNLIAMKTLFKENEPFEVLTINEMFEIRGGEGEGNDDNPPIPTYPPPPPVPPIP